MNRPVGFPTRRDYETALRNHTKSFVWDRLAGAIPQPSPSGMSYFWGAGAFAIVSKVLIGGKEWALRLPIGPQEGVHERSLAIAEEVANGNPLFVPFEYSLDAIEVPVGSGQIRPVTLMGWVEGLTVRDFVIENCAQNNSEDLKRLRDAFTNLARDLRNFGVVHGDLSPDNILVSEERDKIKLQLVDYDSVLIERFGDIPTSVGRTQMRHPGSPRQPDSNSDQFPLLIYYSVLSALIANPTLGVSPDNYDQKFLVDSQILSMGQGNKILQELINAAPNEMTALLDSFKDEYTNTPSIVLASTNVVESTEVILASDWVELTKKSGITVEINGTVLDSTSQNSFVVMKPSNLNRHTTVVIRHLGFPQIRPQTGDHIRAIGTVVIENSLITLQSPFVELVSQQSSQVNDVKFSAIRHRIAFLKDAIQPRRSSGIRVHEIAIELGMTDVEIIDLAGKLGIGVKGSSSKIVDRQADRIRARAARDGLVQS